MAGRGRGRGGKANLSFDISSLGFGAGEALPTQTLQPPSTFPPLQQRPTPLANSEVDDYLLALSQEYRGSIKDSPFYLKAKSFKKDITRYTDRYKTGNQNGETQKWEPDWAYFPDELKPVAGKKTGKRPGSSRGVIPTIIKKANVDVVKKLEELGKKEQKETSSSLEVDGRVENEEDKAEGGEGGEVEEEEQEEEYEDDNDYNFDYYDDGGDHYGDDDDGEEGPIY